MCTLNYSLQAGMSNGSSFFKGFDSMESTSKHTHTQRKMLFSYEYLIASSSTGEEAKKVYTVIELVSFVFRNSRMEKAEDGL